MITSLPTAADRRALRQNLASNLLLLTLAAGAANYARTILGPLQETMRETLSLSDNDIAFLQGPALTIPLLIAAVPLGLLIDRQPRVRLLLIFAFLNLVGTLLTAVAPNFAVLFAARCIVGLTATATAIAAFSLLADLFAATGRGRAATVMAIGQAAGTAAAFAAGGMLLTAASGDDAWRCAIGWLSCPLLVVPLAIRFMREPARATIASTSFSRVSACAELFRYRELFLPLLAGMTMFGIADGAALVWAAPALSRYFHLEPDDVGAIISAVLLVSGFFGPILGGTLADLCQRTGGPGRTLSLLSALAFVSVPAGLFPIVSSVTVMSVLLGVFITIGGVTSLMVVTAATIVIPERLRALSIGVLFAGTMLSAGLAPLTVSVLSGALGGPAHIGVALATVCAGTSLIAAMTFTLGRRDVQFEEAA